MLSSSALRLALRAAARPRAALAVMALLTLTVAPGLGRLEIRTDGNALIPPDDRTVEADREIRERFGLRDPVIVLVESDHPQGIYNPWTLRRIRDLTWRLARLEGVDPEQVVSLATERSFRPHREPPRYRPMLDALPGGTAAPHRLRDEVAAVGLFTGTLVAEGGRAAAVLVGVPPASAGGDSGNRRTLTRRIAQVVAEAEGPPDRISVVGAPVAEALLGDHLLEDLAVLLPAAFALIAAVLWIGCRRAAGVLVGLVQVAAGLVWTFGLMGLLGVPVYLTTAILPVILTCVGLADEIHIFWRFQRRLAESPVRPAQEVVARTFRELSRPVLFTSLTTAVGFLSFAASPIGAVRAFGVFAACGVLFFLVSSLTVLPAVLVLLPTGALRRPGGFAAAAGGGGAPGLLLRRWRRPILAALGLLTVLLGAGAFRLTVQDSWVGGFAPESPLRLATERADRLLGGTHTLLVEVGFPEAAGAGRGAEPLYAPAAVEAVGELERFLAAQPGVGAVLGIHGHLTTARFLRSGQREERRTVPERPEWVFQLVREMAEVRGEARRRELIDDDGRHTVVTVLLRHATYRGSAELMTAIRRYAEERLAPLGARVRLGGDVAVSQAMIPAIVRTQVTSLGLALAGALVVGMLLFRSGAAALTVVAPVAAAVLWVFGLMGWLGVPLGVATSMFCAVTLGIGIDYAVHLFERHRQLEAAGGQEPALAAVATVGPAVVADAAAIALGFGILALSRVPANRTLGLLVAGALAVSCLLTLAGQGAWLAGKGEPGRD